MLSNWERTIKPPYDLDDLRAEMENITLTQEDHFKLEAVTDKATKFLPRTDEGWDKVVARENNMSVKKFVKDPDYEAMMLNYLYTQLAWVIDKIAEEMGFTNKQMWAVSFHNNGLLD